jgi:hypothetical protein
LQLTENLQRAELNPIDTALAMVGYFQIRHAEEGPDAEGIINAMILLEREPGRVKTEVVVTVNTFQKISGKSLSSLKRTRSLLKLPEAIDDGDPAVSFTTCWKGNMVFRRRASSAFLTWCSAATC